MLPGWKQEWELVKTIGCGRIQRKMSVVREPGEHHLPSGGRTRHIPVTVLVPQYPEESLNECVGKEAMEEDAGVPEEFDEAEMVWALQD